MHSWYPNDFVIIFILLCSSSNYITSFIVYCTCYHFTLVHGVDCRSPCTGQYFETGSTCFDFFFWVMLQQHDITWVTTCSCLVATLMRWCPLSTLIRCCARWTPWCQRRENCATCAVSPSAAVWPTVLVVPALCAYYLGCLCRDLSSVILGMLQKSTISGKTRMMWKSPCHLGGCDVHLCFPSFLALSLSLIFW